LIVDEETKPVIEKIFQMSADGMSTTAIAKRLNEDGVPCPVELKKSRGIGYSKKLAEDKALWIQCSVRKIIRDERYLGKMVSNMRRSACVGKNIMLNNKKSDWIIVENTHEAIISEELFQQANTALSARLKTTNKNTNWKESGNLFVCGYCGRKLQRSSSKEVYLYCQKSKYVEDTECSCIHEDLTHIQRKVVETLKLMGNAIADRVIIRKRKVQDSWENLDKQTESLKRQYEKSKLEKRYLYEKYRDGQMTKDEFIQNQARHQEKVTEAGTEDCQAGK